MPATEFVPLDPGNLPQVSIGPDDLRKGSKRGLLKAVPANARRELIKLLADETDLRRLSMIIGCEVRAISEGDVVGGKTDVMVSKAERIFAKIPAKLIVDSTRGENPYSGEIKGFGKISFVVKTSKGKRYASLFVGKEGKSPWEGDNEDKVAKWSRSIIQRIFSGREVSLQNLKLFLLAILDKKIAREIG